MRKYTKTVSNIGLNLNAAGDIILRFEYREHAHVVDFSLHYFVR